MHKKDMASIIAVELMNLKVEREKHWDAKMDAEDQDDHDQVATEDMAISELDARLDQTEKIINLLNVDRKQTGDFCSKIEFENLRSSEKKEG